MCSNIDGIISFMGTNVVNFKKCIIFLFHCAYLYMTYIFDLQFCPNLPKETIMITSDDGEKICTDYRQFSYKAVLCHDCPYVAVPNVSVYNGPLQHCRSVMVNPCVQSSLIPQKHLIIISWDHFNLFIPGILSVYGVVSPITPAPDYMLVLIECSMEELCRGPRIFKYDT